jgi:hypothetical protein
MPVEGNAFRRHDGLDRLRLGSFEDPAPRVVLGLRSIDRSQQAESSGGRCRSGCGWGGAFVKSARTYWFLIGHGGFEHQLQHA